MNHIFATKVFLQKWIAHIEKILEKIEKKENEMVYLFFVQKTDNYGSPYNWLWKMLYDSD